MPAEPERPGEEKLRALLLAHAHQALAEMAGHPALPSSFAVAVADEIWEVIITVARWRRYALPVAVPPGEPPPQLSAPELAVLSACTNVPQTAKRIAGTLNRPCNSHFRGILRGLCRRNPPLLMQTPDGYRLPLRG